MLRPLLLAAALSPLVATIASAAETKAPPTPKDFTFGAYEVLDAATVDHATFSPRTMLLVRTEKPAALLVISRNEPKADLLRQLKTLTFSACYQADEMASAEHARLTSQAIPVVSDLLLRSARDRKPPDAHTAQTLSQYLLRVNAALLAPHFTTYLCDLPTPPPG